MNSVDSEKGRGIDLTIDSGCAACALPVGVASAVGMQELDTAPQEHTAANAKNIWELGVEDSDTQISEWRCAEFEVQCMDKLHNPLVAACKVVAAGNRIVLQPEDRGRSFIEDVRSKRRKRIFDRNGVYVLPCWVVKRKFARTLGTETVGALGQVVPK